MNALDVEIFQHESKGFALAAVFDYCRVYRGNGQVKVVGASVPSDMDANKIAAITTKIERLQGHVGWQGKKKRLKKPARIAASTPDPDGGE